MSEAAATDSVGSLAFRRMTILPGHDKTGKVEPFGRIDFQRGDLVALVGPTGSGKTRLLSDIEWLANGDTPSGRRVLLDGVPFIGASRYQLGNRLVAQLSQTMTFMVDLDVASFLLAHAASRGKSGDATLVASILDAANLLAGEPFTSSTALSRLSGGQARALMIADTALLCQSPVVLIDEVENAGIDRHRALNLLLSNDKLVILATHDPLLALAAPRRLAIRNGGITAVLERTDPELGLLKELELLDRRLGQVRDRLRLGESLM